jgi:hypothetical protein
MQTFGQRQGEIDESGLGKNSYHFSKSLSEGNCGLLSPSPPFFALEGFRGTCKYFTEADCEVEHHTEENRSAGAHGVPAQVFDRYRFGLIANIAYNVSGLQWGQSSDIVDSQFEMFRINFFVLS